MLALAHALSLALASLSLKEGSRSPTDGEVLDLLSLTSAGRATKEAPLVASCGRGSGCTSECGSSVECTTHTPSMSAAETAA